VSNPQKSGRLNHWVQVNRTLTDFLEALRLRGVTVEDLRNTLEHPDCLDAVADAMRSPTQNEEARLRKLATVGDEGALERVRARLVQVNAEWLVRSLDTGGFFTPERFNELLRFATPWKAAAIVLYYGLDDEGRRSEDVVAEEVGRAVNTVIGIVRQPSKTLIDAYNSHLASEQAEPEPDQGLHDLDLSVPTRNLLLEMKINTKEKLATWNESELRERAKRHARIGIGPKRLEEIKVALAAHGLELAST
jgi:hypothetical protein